jgi:hypothetical protein
MIVLNLNNDYNNLDYFEKKYQVQSKIMDFLKEKGIRLAREYEHDFKIIEVKDVIFTISSSTIVLDIRRYDKDKIGDDSDDRRISIDFNVGNRIYIYEDDFIFLNVDKDLRLNYIDQDLLLRSKEEALSSYSVDSTKEFNLEELKLKILKLVDKYKEKTSCKIVFKNENEEGNSYYNAIDDKILIVTKNSYKDELDVLMNHYDMILYLSLASLRGDRVPFKSDVDGNNLSLVRELICRMAAYYVIVNLEGDSSHKIFTRTISHYLSSSARELNDSISNPSKFNDIYYDCLDKAKEVKNFILN